MFENEENKNNFIKMVPYEDYPNLCAAPDTYILPGGEKRGLRKIQEQFLSTKKPTEAIYEALFDFVITGVRYNLLRVT